MSIWDGAQREKKKTGKWWLDESPGFCFSLPVEPLANSKRLPVGASDNACLEHRHLCLAFFKLYSVQSRSGAEKSLWVPFFALHSKMKLLSSCGFLFCQLNPGLFFPQRTQTGPVIFWAARKWFRPERFKTDLQKFSLEISTKQPSLARLRLNHGSNEKERPSSLVDWVLDITAALWKHV